MKNWIVTAIISLAAWNPSPRNTRGVANHHFLTAPSNIPSTALLHVSGNALKDSTGKTVYLDGVNLGGWLLWEGWIWGSAFIKESDMKSRLVTLAGAEQSEKFLEAYYNNFITEKDIAAIAANGFNFVRLPFNHRLFKRDNPSYLNGFSIIDRLLGWCRKYHVYVLLDLHAAPGGQNNYFISDPNKEKLWASVAKQQETVTLWQSIAERYKNETMIAGYDILNEPDAKKTSDLISLYKNCIAAIRATGDPHLLFIEGNKLAHTFKDFPPSLDSNQVYSFHYYAWFGENKKRKNIDEIIKTIPGGGPQHCSEWGEDEPANLEEIKSLLKANPNLCGTAFWTWKRVYKDNKRYPVCSVNTTVAWNRLATWMTWKAFKPTAAEIKKGLEDFLAAIEFDKCTVNKNVVNAAR